MLTRSKRARIESVQECADRVLQRLIEGRSLQEVDNLRNAFEVTSQDLKALHNHSEVLATFLAGTAKTEDGETVLDLALKIDLKEFNNAEIRDYIDLIRTLLKACDEEKCPEEWEEGGLSEDEIASMASQALEKILIESSLYDMTSALHFTEDLEKAGAEVDVWDLVLLNRNMEGTEEAVEYEDTGCVGWGGPMGYKYQLLLMFSDDLGKDPTSTLWHCLAYRGLSDFVGEFATKKYAFPWTEMDEYYPSPIHIASLPSLADVDAGHDNVDRPETLKCLLDSVQDGHLSTTSDGQTPLHWACCGTGHNSKVQKSLKKCDFLDLPPMPQDTNSPKRLALAKELVKILLSKEENGQALLMLDCNGQSPLHVACQNGQDDIVHVLLAHSEAETLETLAIMDKKGRTPLMYSCLKCSLTTVFRFLRASPTLLPPVRQYNTSTSN